VRAALDDPAVKQRFADRVNDVLARGIFGSPQILFRGELFWGTDRLAQLEAALAAA
jgi:2-hydroxychromene-2-carboxylate isomerase